MLDSTKIRYAFGFLYLEYRRETYYWEIVKIIEKMVIIFILNILDGNTKLKGIFCFITIFSYAMLSLKCTIEIQWYLYFNLYIIIY